MEEAAIGVAVGQVEDTGRGTEGAKGTRHGFTSCLIGRLVSVVG